GLDQENPSATRSHRMTRRFVAVSDGRDRRDFARRKKKAPRAHSHGRATWPNNRGRPKRANPATTRVRKAEHPINPLSRTDSPSISLSSGRIQSQPPILDRTLY